MHEAREDELQLMCDVLTRHIEATETGANWIELKARMSGCNSNHARLQAYMVSSLPVA